MPLLHPVQLGKVVLNIVDAPAKSSSKKLPEAESAIQKLLTVRAETAEHAVELVQVCFDSKGSKARLCKLVWPVTRYRATTEGELP